MNDLAPEQRAWRDRWIDTFLGDIDPAEVRRFFIQRIVDRENRARHKALVAKPEPDRLAG